MHYLELFSAYSLQALFFGNLTFMFFSLKRYTTMRLPSLRQWIAPGKKADVFLAGSFFFNPACM